MDGGGLGRQTVPCRYGIFNTRFAGTGLLNDASKKAESKDVPGVDRQKATFHKQSNNYEGGKSTENTRKDAKNQTPKIHHNKGNATVHHTKKTRVPILYQNPYEKRSAKIDQGRTGKKQIPVFCSKTIKSKKDR